MTVSHVKKKSGTRNCFHTAGKGAQHSRGKKRKKIEWLKKKIVFLINFDDNVG